MRKLLMLLAIVLLGITSNAQQGEYFILKKVNETPLRHKNYCEKLKATGKQTSAIVENSFEEILAANTYIASKTKNANIWSTKPMLLKAETKSDAGVVIGGTYTLIKENAVEEKTLVERSTKFNAKIPYKEIRISNKVNLEAVHVFTYPDGNSVTDTFKIEKTSELKPGKELKSLDDLTAKVESSYKSSVRKYFSFMGKEKYYYKFTKLKLKDKALKEEYKNASKLLKGNKINELAQLYMKINTASPSNEAAHCIGMCYELIGNFPKAQEYYSKMPDFATKTRMKKQLAAYDYLVELGMEITFEDFE